MDYGTHCTPQFVLVRYWWEMGEGCKWLNRTAQYVLGGTQYMEMELEVGSKDKGSVEKMQECGVDMSHEEGLACEME